MFLLCHVGSPAGEIFQLERDAVKSGGAKSEELRDRLSMVVLDGLLTGIDYSWKP
jgi:hypothetical protein